MLKERIFLAYLAWQCRPSIIRRHLERSGMADERGRDRRGDEAGVGVGAAGRTLPGVGRAGDERPGVLRVGALQIKLTYCSSPLEYVDMMEGWMRKAAGARVELLAFPEYNILHLLGLLPGMADAGRDLEKENAGADGPVHGGKAATATAGPGMADVVRFAGPVLNSVVHETFSGLAKKYGLYIMAGSFPVPQGSRVVNRSLLFGPGGGLVGSQEKVHLMPREYDEGLSRGDAFRVFNTTLGKVAVPVCMDATFFETSRILRGLGADIVIIPIFDTVPYNFWMALRGIWPRVQEGLFYGIKSVLVGEFMGQSARGLAGVYAPIGLTPGRDGVLAQLGDPEGEGLAVADLDLEALYRLRAEHPYMEDKNPALMRKYFPDIYREVKEYDKERRG